MSSRSRLRSRSAKSFSAALRSPSSETVRSYSEPNRSLSCVLRLCCIHAAIAPITIRAATTAITIQAHVGICSSSRVRRCSYPPHAPGNARHNREVAEWRIAGTYLEFCNCDPGCGCNFRGLPSSPEGNCQAVISHVIEAGSRDRVDLAGAKVSWALWWPGPIHERGGRGHAYVDANGEQYEVLERIWRGEEGYGLFEIFNSTLDEPTTVARAENEVRIVKTKGFIWRNGEIAESERFQIELPEMSWDLANRHCVFSQF